MKNNPKYLLLSLHAGLFAAINPECRHEAIIIFSSAVSAAINAFLYVQYLQQYRPGNDIRRSIPLRLPKHHSSSLPTTNNPKPGTSTTAAKGACSPGELQKV